VDGVTAVVLGELVAFRGTAPYNVTTLLGSGGGASPRQGSLSSAGGEIGSSLSDEFAQARAAEVCPHAA
jgi:hypothetical protein